MVAWIADPNGKSGWEDPKEHRSRQKRFEINCGRKSTN
jgi:hypothetical protein